MKIELSPQQMELQAEFREFAYKEIAPYAAENDIEEKLNGEIVRKLAQKGYLGSMLPKKYGGMELDTVSIGILNEEVGKGCSSARSLLTVHGMVSLAILRWGTDEQKEYYLSKMASGEIIGAFGLTEPNVGSDAKSIETAAVLSGDEYILNGTKKWITMSQIAHIFLIFAQCEGKPTAFLVERNAPGFSVEPMSGLLGARASMIGELHFESCRIPKHAIVGTVGSGLTHVALAALDYGRYTVACGYVGLAQACLEESIRYSRKRKQFNAPLRESQLIQKMITEMVVSIKAARLMCYNAGYLKDVMDPDSLMETWNAKYFASKAAVLAANYAVQIHGANGYCNKYPVERLFRDAKCSEIIEGTSQMHEVLIATNAFRHI
ncbi:MAG TPA: acyl-CoA dehydrogenase family protein [Ruminiclostridium sp.]|nr:acyl-CoA dehydrogenase family protein [Ruminiclostridium sp.]